ncbi:2,3-butanediol dehydrogenase [Rhodococcus sp. NPDC059234]|uniref:2,3-butanediol dehydrogenase n=1 Tax=Rhodococcus sp. NPDC059234 TaxID=3346781 RepID=UPI0036732033
MRAARYHGVGDIRFEDIAEPTVGPGQVKVRVHFNGLCGSDLHEYFHAPMMAPTAPHPLTGVSVPVVLGHEFSGEIVEIGPAVDQLSVGDTVAVEPTVNCRQCVACRAGSYNLCSTIAAVGYSWAGGGGLGQYAVVDADHAYRLPPGMSTREGALIEPLAVALHAVHRGEVPPGSTVAVHGAGPIGIGVFLTLRAHGIDDIAVIEPSAARRAAIEAVGATNVIDPSNADVVAELRARTNGDGVSRSFDTAGVPATFLNAVRSTASHGRVVVVAVHQRPVDFNPTEILFSECEIVGSIAYCDDYPEAIDLMARGAYPIESWVKTIAFGDLISDGLEPLRDQKAIKVLVDMNAVD